MNDAGSAQRAATGVTVTIVFNTVDKDLHVVDNGDGTFTITALGAGGFKVIGPDRTLRDPGRIVFQFTVDTNGTPQDPFDDPEPDPDSFEIIRDMTIVPITRSTILQLAVITLLPVAPLLLTMVSLEELLTHLLQVVF